MGLSERYLRPFPFAVFFERTPGPPSFSSMNFDRPKRLVARANSENWFVSPIGCPGGSIVFAAWPKEGSTSCRDQTALPSRLPGLLRPLALAQAHAWAAAVFVDEFDAGAF